MHRLHRKKIAEIFKLLVNNSICAYRESRKRDKYMVELATRAYDPDLRSLIVKCLNKFQDTVRAAQKDLSNAELMEQIKELESVEDTKQELIKAKAVADPIDLVSTPVAEGKRARKPVKRYADAFWVDDKELHEGDDDFEERLVKVRAKKGRKGRKKGRSTKAAGKKRVSDEVEPDSDSEFVADGSESDTSSEFEHVSEDEEAEWNQSGSENEEGNEGEAFLSVTTSESKRRKQAWEAMKSEKQEDEGARKLRLLLTIDANKVYTDADLENEEVLTLGLEVTYCMRMGQSLDKVPSVHINVSDQNAHFQQLLTIK